MTTRTIFCMTVAALLVTALTATPVSAQRQGTLDAGSIGAKVLIANGPKGPIHGGESSVTDMIPLADGMVYGSTESLWGAENCHIFHLDGETVVHDLNVTSKLSGQPKITDMAAGPGNILIGGTSTYNKTFDENPSSYEGGHLFSYDPATGAFVDHGVVQRRQGINCVAVDTLHTRIYCVTYPAAHLFSYDYESGEKTDYGQVMFPWKVKDLGRVSWRGVPKVLMIDDAGTVYFSTYYSAGNKADDQGDLNNFSGEGGRIMRLAYGDTEPVFTGATVPTQKGMHNDPIYENTITCALKARDGGFWCGTSVDGFLFKFFPSTSTVVNKGKAFNYWNLKSITYGGDGRLYMLGGRDYDNPWLLRYDTTTGSMECLGWPTNYTQCGVISTAPDGRVLMADNMRNSYVYFYDKSK